MISVDLSDDDVYRQYAGDLTRYATVLVGPADAPDVVVEAVLERVAARSAAVSMGASMRIW